MRYPGTGTLVPLVVLLAACAGDPMYSDTTPTKLQPDGSYACTWIVTPPPDFGAWTDGEYDITVFEVDPKLGPISITVGAFPIDDAQAEQVKTTGRMTFAGPERFDIALRMLFRRKSDGLVFSVRYATVHCT